MSGRRLGAATGGRPAWLALAASLAAASSLSLALITLSGCGSDVLYLCDRDEGCMRGGLTGSCLPSPTGGRHYCAFADVTCERWDTTAGEGLAGQCVASSASDASASDGPASAGDGSSLLVDGAQAVDAASPADAPITSDGATRPTDLQVLPPDAAVGSLTRVPTGTSLRWNGVWTSGGAVLLVGTDTGPNVGKMLRSSDAGKTWSDVTPAPIDSGVVFYAAVAGVPSAVYASGLRGDGRGVVLVSRDGGVSFAPSYGSAPAGLNALVAVSATDVWAAGGNALVTHLTAGAWLDQATTGSTTLRGLYVDGAGHVRAVGDGATLLSGTAGTSFVSSTIASAGGQRLNGIAGSSASDLWVVGGDGFGNEVLVHYDGAAWLDVHPSPHAGALQAIWGPSTDDLWMVGDGGHVLRKRGAGTSAGLYSGALVDSGCSQTELNGVGGGGASNVFLVGDCGFLLHAP